MEMQEKIAPLGPLKSLAGIWEGQLGDDIAPSDDRGVENNRFRERAVFEPIGQVNNHEQTLWGLRYSTMVWRLNEPNPFHEEVGYWLWEPATEMIYRCFIVPRGVTVLAGGKAGPDAKSFELHATCGETTLGICSNLFLDREFKTQSYRLSVRIHDQNSWSYEENSQLLIKGQTKPFDHIDRNTLRRST